MDAVDTRSLTEWFEGAQPFERYLEGTLKNHELWLDLYARARLPAWVATLPRRPDLRFLVIAEDWCGDAVNTVPLVARLAECLGVEVRVLARDQNLELMDRYLTGGHSRSIPVVIVIDASGNEVGWWGPRPQELQDWVLGEGQQLDKDSRYREQRRWYARDRGETTLRELTRLWLAQPASAG